jgi:hypothetical protein
LHEGLPERAVASRTMLPSRTTETAAPPTASRPYRRKCARRGHARDPLPRRVWWALRRPGRSHSYCSILAHDAAMMLSISGR